MDSLRLMSACCVTEQLSVVGHTLLRKRQTTRTVNRAHKACRRIVLRCRFVGIHGQRQLSEIVGTLHAVAGFALVRFRLDGLAECGEFDDS